MPSPDPRSIADGPPLVTEPDGTPIVFPALSLSLHLEPLERADEERFDAVNAMVMDWIGARLRWTSTSAFPPLDQFRPQDLEYVTSYPSTLSTPETTGDPEADDLAAGLHALSRDDYAVYCHGAAVSNEASPYSFRFHAEIPAPTAGAPLETASMLRVTVPLGWPLEDFVAHCAQIASALRVRWGVAGLGYSAWEADAFDEVRAAIYAHARRHPGFDLGEYASLLAPFHDAMRTVSFLNFVGPALLARLRETNVTLVSDERLTIMEHQGMLLVRAGAEPDPGDRNRLQVPAAYRRADELLRPLRAKGIHFGEPWTEDASAEWLERFERSPA